MQVEPQLRHTIGALIYDSLFRLEELGVTLPDAANPGSQQAMREFAEQLSNSIADLVEKQGTPPTVA